MNKIAKILFVVASSLSLTVSAIAGELSVTGSAKASYSIGGASDHLRKGIGISNEFALGASGELDNGYTWTYNLDFDPNQGGTVDNDDQSLVIGMGDLGAIGIYVSEGGLSKEFGYGVGSLGTGQDYAGVSSTVFGYDISDNENIQYHLPSGLLPFGLTAKVGYAPELNAIDSQDFKEDGAQVSDSTSGTSATHYQVTAAPMDGLAIGADYYSADDATGAYQSKESGSAYAKYTMGNITVGYNRSLAAPNVATASKYAADNHYNYETDQYGIQFDVNDSLSVSYTREKSERKSYAVAAAGTGNTARTAQTSDVDSIQAAYVIGGATVGVAIVEGSDSDYTANKDEKQTLFSLAMEF
jgi:hypothetical protein